MRQAIAQIVAALHGVGLLVLDDGSGRIEQVEQYAGRDRCAFVRLVDSGLSGTSATARRQLELVLMYDATDPFTADERAVADLGAIIDAITDIEKVTDVVEPPGDLADGQVQLDVTLDVLRLRTSAGDLADDIEDDGAVETIAGALSYAVDGLDRLTVARPLTPADVEDDDGRTIWSTLLQCVVDHHATQTWAKGRAALEARLAADAKLLFAGPGPGHDMVETYTPNGARLRVRAIAGAELSREVDGALLVLVPLTVHTARSS